MSVARLQTRPTGARTGVVLALIAAALLVLTPAARAEIGETIVLRCTHHQSISGYTPSDYEKALEALSADTEEYSSCPQRIREAELAAAAGHSGGGTAGAAAPAPIPATPAQQQAIAHAQQAGSEPVKLSGGQVVHPGVVHVNVASAVSSLPTPVLALLAFLLAGALLVAGAALRNRARGRAR